MIWKEVAEVKMIKFPFLQAGQTANPKPAFGCSFNLVNITQSSISYFASEGGSGEKEPTFFMPTSMPPEEGSSSVSGVPASWGIRTGSSRGKWHRSKQLLVSHPSCPQMVGMAVSCLWGQRVQAPDAFREKDKSRQGVKLV